MLTTIVEQAFESAAERGRAMDAYEAQPTQLAYPLGIHVAEGEVGVAMAEWREWLATDNPTALSAEPDLDAMIPEGLRLTDLYREFAGQRAAL